MTVKAATQFDLSAFKRAYEEWDIEALLGLYADEVELVQIDRDNPPSSARVRHGKEVLLRVPRRPQSRRQRDLRDRGRPHRPRARRRRRRSEGVVSMQSILITIPTAVSQLALIDAPPSKRRCCWERPIRERGIA
jgi:hypothetical protein